MDVPDLSKLQIDANQRGASNAERLRRRRVWWIVVLAFVFSAAAALGWFSGWLSAPIETQTVKVAQAFPSRALAILNASGYVVAQRKAAVSSKATGRLQKLFVEEGKAVKAGDLLGQLENDDLKANLEEAQAALKVADAALKNAEAELEDATLNYNRSQALRKTGALSEQAFDAAEARYKKAVAMERSAQFGIRKVEASMRVAEVNLEYSLIRAPFDGVILTKNADEGEVVAPFGASLNAKAAVATMADMKSLLVEVDVSESSLEKVLVGGAAEIRLDALPNDRFLGTVYMIVPTADRAKATVLTKVRFNELDPRVLPEMSAKVAFLSRALKPGENEPFLGIPVSAVRKSDGAQVVFRVNRGSAHEVPVQTGKQWGDTVQVISGLTEGDIVVLRPEKGITDGSRVKVKE